MAAPFLRVPNPDLVMFNVANTVTASTTIADAQPDFNRTPDQVLIEVDLDYNIHHVLNFRNNYDIDTIIRAWSQNRRRVIIEENDEGIQTSATSVQEDSQPSASIKEFRLITDFSGLLLICPPPMSPLEAPNLPTILLTTPHRHTQLRMLLSLKPAPPQRIPSPP